MEKKENNLPGLNNHNSFARIIKNLWGDNFVFTDCWYERINENTWREIFSRRFKNVVFKRNGEFEKYIIKHLPVNSDDFEELERVISIYSSIFTKTNSNKQKSYIEKECREVFYTPELTNKVGKYACIHNKLKYFCAECRGVDY